MASTAAAASQRRPLRSGSVSVSDAPRGEPNLCAVDGEESLQELAPTAGASGTGAGADGGVIRTAADPGIFWNVNKESIATYMNVVCGT